MLELLQVSLKGPTNKLHSTRVVLGAAKWREINENQKRSWVRPPARANLKKDFTQALKSVSFINYVINDLLFQWLIMA